MRNVPARVSFLSESELRSLSNGKCPCTGAQADDDLVYILTDPDAPPYMLQRVEEWLAQSEKGDLCEYTSRLRASLRDRESFFPIIGELMSAYFLREQLGLNAYRISAQAGRRIPDFEVKTPEGNVFLVEVKTICGGLSGRQCGGFIAAPSRIPKVRNSIKNALGQLDKSRYNLILIADWYSPPVDDHQLIFATRSMLRKNINTRVSTVGVITGRGQDSDCYGLFVHNPHAEKCIPPALFGAFPQFTWDESSGEIVTFS